MNGHNPDILTCLANLSADEVFTPPKLASAMLDILPKDLFRRPDTTFLDPVCKSGVFLREIAGRLNDGLRDQMPDEQARINHILTKQVFGLAITELTSLLSRRSVYCSKKADGKYSIVTAFTKPDGNIRLPKTQHKWNAAGRCDSCGANRGEYDRDETLESYAYPFIHGIDAKELFNVKFDVIIGNPPYQLNVGVEKENYAIPLYHTFVSQAMKLEPRFLTMIIPSRWFTGGRGLDEFREKMLADRRIRKIVDYTDSRDCFPGVDVSGGVMYFLWDRDSAGLCDYTNVSMGKPTTLARQLDEYQVFPRYNEALSIIKKVLSKMGDSMATVVSSQTPFGLHSSFRGSEKPSPGAVKVLTSRGMVYAEREAVTRNADKINTYKVTFSKATTEHGGQANKSGLRQVLSSIRVIGPKCVCTQSYLLAGTFNDEGSASNMANYLRTRFVRFLLLQAITSQDISKDKFCFVPTQTFDRPWTDAQLFEKYGLSADESDLISSMVRPIENGDE